VNDIAAPMPRFFTIAQIAELLNVCTKTVRNCIDHGELRKYHVGRQVRIADADLRLFLERGRK
jgi:excisionase family DNA binding protein